MRPSSAVRGLGVVRPLLIDVSRLAGYEGVNDAERLAYDPIFRQIGSETIRDRGAALTSRLQTFETEMGQLQASKT
jgi:hypothetical protein